MVLALQVGVAANSSEWMSVAFTAQSDGPVSVYIVGMDLTDLEPVRDPLSCPPPPSYQGDHSPG